MEQRQQVLQAAYEAHPERFVQGRPQMATLPTEVWINRPPAKTILMTDDQDQLNIFNPVFPTDPASAPG